MLLAEHGECRAQHRTKPPAPARGQDGAEDPRGREQLRSTDEAGYGFDVHGVPREDEPRPGGTEERQPAHQYQDEQHGHDAMPERVHQVQPSGAAARQRPVDSKTQNRDGPIQPRA